MIFFDIVSFIYPITLSGKLLIVIDNITIYYYYDLSEEETNKTGYNIFYPWFYSF